MSRIFITLLFLSLLVHLVGCGPQRPPTTITISAASNLIPAFEELGRRYEAETGYTIIFNFGASGKLAQQIEQGAPVDLFVSANTAYVRELAERGLIRPETVEVYALGRLTLWTRDESEFVPQTVADLADPAIERVAIANPNHAPYGLVAREVLQRAGLRTALQDKLIMGDNVQQALQYGQTGNVDVALVPLSLVINLKEGQYHLIPVDLHEPIEQGLGLVTASQHAEAAQAFADFVTSPIGREVLSRYGYDLP